MKRYEFGLGKTAIGRAVESVDLDPENSETVETLHFIPVSQEDIPLGQETHNPNHTGQPGVIFRFHNSAGVDVVRRALNDIELSLKAKGK